MYVYHIKISFPFSILRIPYIHHIRKLAVERDGGCLGMRLIHTPYKTIGSGIVWRWSGNETIIHMRAMPGNGARGLKNEACNIFSSTVCRL